MKEKVSMLCAVESVKEYYEKQHVKGVGAEALFKNTLIGWAIHLGAPTYLMIVVPDKPPFDAGSTVKLSLEVVDAKP
jgi:hypothetical protein